jgi:hypothetical protein
LKFLSATTNCQGHSFFPTGYNTLFTRSKKCNDAGNYSRQEKDQEKNKNTLDCKSGFADRSFFHHEIGELIADLSEKIKASAK